MNDQPSPSPQGGFFALPHPAKMSPGAYEDARRTSSMTRLSKRKARGGGEGPGAATGFIRARKAA